MIEFVPIPNFPWGITKNEQNPLVSGWVPINDVKIHKGIISELEKKKV